MDPAAIKASLDLLHQEVKGCREDLAEVTHQVKTVTESLTGNPFGSIGLVKRVENIESKEIETVKKLDEHDRKLWLWGIIATGVGSAAAWLVSTFVSS